MPLSLRYAARSDVGLIREGNEDSAYAGPALLMVADGMGGHAAGELASAIAVAIVADLDVHPPEPSEVLVIPILLGDRVVNILYSHVTDRIALGESALEDAARVAAAASTAYARIIRQREADRRRDG